MLAASTPRHLTVTEIHDRVQKAGWRADHSAVHRTLADFTEWGLTHPLAVAGPLAYGLSVPPHHHTICDRCGDVAEIPADALTGAVTAIEDLTGFSLASGGVTLHGLCTPCRIGHHP